MQKAEERESHFEHFWFAGSLSTSGKQFNINALSIIHSPLSAANPEDVSWYAILLSCRFTDYVMTGDHGPTNVDCYQVARNSNLSPI